MCPAEPAGQPLGWTAAREDEGDDAGEGKRCTESEKDAELGVAGDGLKFEEEREPGDTEEDDEAQHAVEQGRGEAGGGTRGSVAADVERFGGVAPESAEEEGVVEISDPGDDVGPVQREGDALRAEEQPPAPRVERESHAGDEGGEGDGPESELPAQVGELAPVDAPHEQHDEEGGEGIAGGAAGRGVEE